MNNYLKTYDCLQIIFKTQIRLARGQVKEWSSKIMSELFG